jgi:2-oxoisovalerate dehydrogenase E1 component
MLATKKQKKTKNKSSGSDLGPEMLLKAYKIMRESRALDEKMLILIRQGKSYFHIGCMGHEALQVACGMAMKNGDFLFPYYRDQALCMALGQTSYECLLAFLAKADDPHGGGRQMPMHYGNRRLNIPTSSSSTGTQFLQAVGCSFASLKENKAKVMDVTVVTTGEGTTSQGEFYEALSWAARKKAPLVFLVENNRFAISVEINDQRPGGVIAENFMSFSDLTVKKVDGCDFEASFKVLNDAIDHARMGKGPVLIDADVVRLLPHSSSDDDKKYRSAKDLEKDKSRDPLQKMRELLLKNKIISAKKLDELDESIKNYVDEQADLAGLAKVPDAKDAEKHVWAEVKEIVFTKPQIDENEAPTVMVDAINRALREGLSENPRMLVFGQDVAHGKGGVFTATRELTKEFGEKRCFNAPLAEASIVGVAIGLALRGFRPVPEIQFGDYIWTAMMQIRNELATIRYRSNNQFSAPVVIRVPVGGYIHGGLCHSQNIEATFAHFPGLKIALPSTALDAYGLLKHALKSEDPVLFLEHKALYRQSFARSILPKNDWELPFGQGEVRKMGQDISVITYGILVQRALEAALVLEEQGISVEVIDLRTIVPYDRALVFESVKKTGKVLVLHEDMQFMGFGAEIASDIAENCFMDLDAPVKRLGAKNTPVPYSAELEEEILPQMRGILQVLKDLAAF